MYQESVLENSKVLAEEMLAKGYVSTAPPLPAARRSPVPALMSARWCPLVPAHTSPAAFLSRRAGWRRPPT